ncbi:PKD-like family lipoprotein [Carboxylicivirga sp. M1479]|uniref:PKD-like family lipoprotein n=1 Tax=Carboxylicivirga sp. M1479 TaxID=2594476 RepID=UPI00163DCAB1|nr:PKD-like family lipoprotein [Carboxylicivirga sp. M1479]
MKTYILFAAIVLMALGGCLQDEGNYEYLDLNEVQGITGIEESYSMTKFEDVLIINPVIDFKHETDADYEYEWSLSHWEYNDESRDRDNFEIIISQDKNLEFVADHTIPYKDLFGIFKVTNKNTGVVYTHDFELRVQNAYQYGYFFLCEKDMNSELFLVRDNGKTIDNLYETLTGMPLVGQPYCMESVRSGITTDLVMFTSDGPDYGAVMNFDNMDYKWPALKCFHEENTGESMVVNYFAARDDIFTIVNNKYYFTGGRVYGDYKPYIGIDVPDVMDDVDYVDEMGMALAYLHGTDPGDLYALGSWGAINKVEIDGEPLLLPGKCHFMAPEPGGHMYQGGVSTHFIITDNNGVVNEVVLHAALDFSTWTNAYTLTRTNVFSAPELITDETMFVNSNSERYFYFSSENKIYRYNYDAPADAPALIAELPAGQNISYLYLDYTQEGWTKYDDKFVVGTYDNSGLNNGSIYFVNLDGSIATQYEHVCGKIIDLEVKK